MYNLLLIWLNGVFYPSKPVSLKILISTLNFQMKKLKEKQYHSSYVSQSISKILEKITNNENHEQELKYLMDKCVYSEDSVTSLAASSALILLVKNKVLRISSVLSQLLASLSFVKSHIGILTVVCELMKIDVRFKINSNKKYKCEYNLQVPKHPLILILNQHPNAWYSILNKLRGFYEDKEIALYANELMHAFYMYVICNPSLDTNLNLQDKLWNYVININDEQSLDIVLHIIMWFPFSGKNSVKASYFFIDLTRSERFRNNHEFREVVMLWLISIVYELIKFEEDPETTVNCLYNVIEQGCECLENSMSIIVVMLSNSISLSHSVHLYDLLRLGKLLLTSNSLSEFALKSLKAALLHWKAFDCLLTKKSTSLLSELLQIINTTRTYKNTSKNIYSNKLFKLLSCSNEYLNWIADVTILGESLNQFNTLKLLEKINDVPIYVLSDFINFLTSILLQDDCTSEVILKVIELLSKVIESYKGLSTQMLILLMYKLSHCKDPQISFALLQAVPKTAILEENLPLVLNILKLARDGLVGMKSFSLILFYNLWETSNKSYSYLQSILSGAGVLNQSETEKIEFYITKAYVAKQLCIKSPERYGNELVSHLSEILNSCTKNSGTLATSLALDGIILLCKSGIISIDSTFKALEPLFDKETRTSLIKKVCEFTAEINHFDSSEYSDELIATSITKLFGYATTSESAEVVSAAYNALGSFPVEEVTTELNLIVDSKFKTTSKSDKNCWISLLENTKTSNLDFVGDFFIKYVSVEIDNYRKSIYVVTEGCKEPPTYKYLPQQSIVRALGNYLKRMIQVWQDTSKFVYLQCLRVLSQEYSKILPPLDWCFLQELIHVPEARLYCITIASHQVQLSGTARRLMENYIEAMVEVHDKDEDIVTVYKQLKYLCNSIQPMTLRPFVENTIKYALKHHEAETKNISLLQLLVEHLRQIFTDETLQEANKVAFAQVIANMTQQKSIDSSAFSEILQCVVKLPKRFIDELSSPKLWKASSVTKLKLSVKIRCAVAVDTNSLSWMNEFIDETSFMAQEQNFVLRNIAKLVKSYRNSDCASTWLLEYLNHVQSTIANENMSNYNLQFLCNVFIISMIILSGYEVFLESTEDLVCVSENHLIMFSQSLPKLMKIKHWNTNIVQIAEWLFHMSIYPETPIHYRKIFYQTLVAMRNENALQGTSKWMKYIAHTIPS